MTVEKKGRGEVHLELQLQLLSWIREIRMVEILAMKSTEGEQEQGEEDDCADVASVRSGVEKRLLQFERQRRSRQAWRNASLRQ